MSEYCTHGQHCTVSDCYTGRMAQQRQEISTQTQHQGAAGMQAGFPRPTTSTACKDAHRPGVPEVNALQAGAPTTLARRQSLASTCDCNGKLPHFVVLVKVRPVHATSEALQ